MSKILIVEDEKVLRTLLSEELRSQGFDVLEADNGELAFNLFHAQKPDLIISDLMMPLMDGYGLYKKIKELREDFPYILVTGFPDELNRFDIKTSGKFVILQKPFDDDKLLSTISNLLSSHQ